jgi:hypothetical protein
MERFKDAGEAVWYSFTNVLAQIISFLPAILGAIVVLLIGWLISGVLARLLERGLKTIGLEHAVVRSGVGDFIARSGTTWTVSKIIAELVKWIIRLIFIQAAAGLLGMPQLTSIINSIILFIPNVIVAMAIIVIGALIARFLARLVQGSVAEMGVANPIFFARLTQYAVIGFSVVAAINQLGIARAVVNTLFIGLVASIALAVGLAFGLGGRDVAGQITRGWYEGGRHLADASRRRAEEIQPRPMRETYPPTGTQGGRGPEPGYGD